MYDICVGLVCKYLSIWKKSWKDSGLAFQDAILVRGVGPHVAGPPHKLRIKCLQIDGSQKT